MSVTNSAMETESPTEKYNLDWKINKFSRHFEGVESAIFQPYSNMKSLFCVLIRYTDVYWCSKSKPHLRCEILLRRLDNEENLSNLGVGFHLQFSDTEESVLKKFHSRCTKFTFGEDIVMGKLFVNSKVFDIENRWVAFNGREIIPRDDTMIVKIQFEFFCRNVTTKSNAPLLIRALSQNVPDLSISFDNLYKTLITDITIRIDDTVLQAHRSVLVASSSVFKRKLENSEIKSLTITEVDPDIFECFLKYLYAGVLRDKTFSTAYRLYPVAVEYGTPSLQEECAEVLASNLNAENVCSVLDLSFAHSDKSLKDKAVSFVSTCLNGIESRKE